MIKKRLNEQIDLLGEERAGKFLEKAESLLASAAEQTLTELIHDLFMLKDQTNKLDPPSPALQGIPEAGELQLHAPMIYWLLVTASEHSDKKRKKEIDKAELSLIVKTRLKQAMPKRGVYRAYVHATNLANPLYTYTLSKKRTRMRTSFDAGVSEREITATVAVPTKPIYRLSYCNEDFRKVLFATCRFHGVGEEKLPNLESLVNLLVDLGFGDAGEADYVSSFITLITGSFYHRNPANGTEYRHISEDRK